MDHREDSTGWTTPSQLKLKRTLPSLLAREGSAPKCGITEVSAWAAFHFLIRLARGVSEPRRPSPWFALAGEVRDARPNQRTPIIEIFHISIATRILAWPIPLAPPATPSSLAKQAKMCFPLANDTEKGIFAPGYNLIIEGWRTAKFSEKHISLVERGFMPSFVAIPKATKRNNYSS